ncbi:MAG TPA: ArsC family reductase [Ramlibacter sp.]|nr:ArsC family reductase [Ramlibacter sp.]
MTITVYGIPNCDTVKKARAWLAGNGAGYTFHDFRKQGLDPAQLDRWIEELGWEKLVNRKGTTWRKLDPEVQDGVTNVESARRLMLENVSVIKRPVVEWGRQFTVGFDPAQWALLVHRA